MLISDVAPLFSTRLKLQLATEFSFSTGVSLITATHETSLQSRRGNIEYAEPITIGNDCWLGAYVTILPGVTIGNGCTIGAGSVVKEYFGILSCGWNSCKGYQEG